jgi:tRNA(fMet)-specific endonuclease VapC
MKYMLDTNICIYLIKKKPISVFEKFKQLSPGDICISSITLSELCYGVEKSKKKEKNLNALYQFIIPLGISDFDYNAAFEYGMIRTELENNGKLIGPMDILIASHARSLNMTLVTNNEKEFKRVENLRVENWID